MNGMTARRLCPSERYAAREIFAISMHGRIPDPEAAREECEKGMLPIPLQIRIVT